jgi:hypothetical protein
VVASQDWLTLLAGWLLTSPALQSLLTFFPQRPQALPPGAKRWPAGWPNCACCWPPG